MFYLKHKGKKLTICDNNVYTRCPVCGREHPVDLMDILAGGDCDLYGTVVYCEECSCKRDNVGKQLEPHRTEIVAIAKRHDTTESKVREIVVSALVAGLSVQAGLAGARLALSTEDGTEEFFTVNDVAAILGTDEQTAAQEMEKTGVSPARITTLPGFEWLLGK
ncbi:hypothetical protein [Candidatus Agathobaculum pullicola]|uniref:hypothetical protein n=1 Tax=Candidatus Agathobaculum pullicola TaxID=2838426 RepID=UPI003F93D158